MPESESSTRDETNDNVTEVSTVSDVTESSLQLPSVVESEVTDPFGSYVEDLPVWLQRQASSSEIPSAEQSEGQQYTAVLSAAMAEVAALREQLAAQMAVSQQAKEDAATATAAATTAKAELLAYQMSVRREGTASPIAPSTVPSSASSQAEEASCGKEVEDQLTMRDALDELSSISDKWCAQERDAKETLKKRGSEQRIPIEQLSTLIEAKLAAAQYAFERDEAMQRSRRLRSELNNVLKRVQPGEEIETGS